MKPGNNPPKTNPLSQPTPLGTCVVYCSGSLSWAVVLVVALMLGLSGLGQNLSAAPLVSARLVSGAVILAQAAELPIEPFLLFLGKVMALIGVVMIFFGGWRIHRGETSEGLLAIIGGFIVALAIPIMRFIAGLAGNTF